MEDPVEINRRIERLLRRVRRRDDYGELLFSGEIIRSRDDIDDPGEWRAAIRKKSRADRIKVRTGETAGKVWALVNSPRSSDVLLEGRRFFVLADRAIGEAESRGHEARVALRDAEEALVKCDGCGAPLSKGAFAPCFKASEGMSKWADPTPVRSPSDQTSWTPSPTFGQRRSREAQPASEADPSVAYGIHAQSEKYSTGSNGSDGYGDSGGSGHSGQGGSFGSSGSSTHSTVR